MTTKSIPWFLRHVRGQMSSAPAERPPGSNLTEFGEQFGWNGVSWCVEFGWDMYDDAGVVLPAKTASCVAMYDTSVKAGLHYSSDHCVPGDSVIRTWQHLSRDAPGFDPEQTHFQIVVDVETVSGAKYLHLVGGNQGDAGYVGPQPEAVRAGDVSILGGLAFHRLFGVPQPAQPHHDKGSDGGGLPATKSHPHGVSAHTRDDIAALAKTLAARQNPATGAVRTELEQLAAAVRHALDIK